jgi:iron complex outermembrane receptor protein
LDHTLRLNFDIFHYMWSNLQFSTTIAPQLTAVSNAGDATLTGAEVNGIYKPTPALTLTAGVVLLHTDYNYFPYDVFSSSIKPYLPSNQVYTTYLGSQTTNVSGNQLINAPNVTVNWTGQYDHDFGNGSIAYARVEYQYVSKVYFDPTDVSISERAPLNLIGASIGYEPVNSHWKVALWGKNLTDQQYITNFSTGTPITAPAGDPRTYGIRIEYTY